METLLPYLIVGLCVAGLVLIETWWEHRKMDEFDPERGEFVFRGVSNSILYGTFWPTALILFVLGRVIRRK